MNKQDKKKKIVILGGGHGGSIVLGSLIEHDFDLSAVVSMADDGGSTGRLRKELGVLPPGDIRQYLVTGSKSPDMKKLFSYRFESGDLKGHSFGNLFLSAGEAMTGSLERSIEIARQALDCQAQVIPVTEDKVGLVLAQSSGTVRGEDSIFNTQIDETSEPELYLEPAGEVSDSAKKAINEADLVIISPGILYCSIVPILLVDGMAEALKQTKAKIAYICNLVNIPQHTRGFTVTDYVEELGRFSSKGLIDYVIFNTAEIDGRDLRAGEEPVIINQAELDKAPYEKIGADVLGSEKAAMDASDEIAANRALLIHDRKKLGLVIEKLTGRI